MKKTILITKLKNGEILIGDTSLYHQDYKIIVKDSLQIILTNEGISFINFNSQLGDNPELTISMENILYQYEAKEEIIDFYNEHFSNILVPANAEVDIKSIIQ